MAIEPEYKCSLSQVDYKKTAQRRAFAERGGYHL